MLADAYTRVGMLRWYLVTVDDQHRTGSVFRDSGADRAEALTDEAAVSSAADDQHHRLSTLVQQDGRRMSLARHDPDV